MRPFHLLLLFAANSIKVPKRLMAISAVPLGSSRADETADLFSICSAKGPFVISQSFPPQSMINIGKQGQRLTLDYPICPRGLPLVRKKPFQRHFATSLRRVRA